MRIPTLAMVLAIVSLAGAGRSDEDGIRGYLAPETVHLSPDSRFGVFHLAQYEPWMKKIACLWVPPKPVSPDKPTSIRLADCIPLAGNTRWFAGLWGNESNVLVLKNATTGHYGSTLICELHPLGETGTRYEIENITHYLADDYLRRHPVEDRETFKLGFIAKGFLSHDAEILISYDAYSKQEPDCWDYYAAYDRRTRTVRVLSPNEATQAKKQQGPSRKAKFIVPDSQFPAVGHKRRLEGDMDETVSFSNDYRISVHRDADWTSSSLLTLSYDATGRYKAYDWLFEDAGNLLVFAGAAPTRWEWAKRSNVFGVCVGGAARDIRLIHGRISRAKNGAGRLVMTDLSPMARKLVNDAFNDTYVDVKVCRFDEDDHRLTVQCSADGESMRRRFSLTFDDRTDQVSLRDPAANQRQRAPLDADAERSP